MTNNHIHIFASQLALEINLLKNLNLILEREQEVLGKNQFNDLEALTVQKDQLTAELENSTAARNTLLNDYYSGTETNPLQELLKLCTAEDRIQIDDLNSTLTSELMKCRELNLVNGQVIANNIHARQELIGLLSENPVNSIGIYTAEGQIEPTSTARHHQKA